jgi:hypothetical protein
MAEFTSTIALYRHQAAGFKASQAAARKLWRRIPEAAYRDLKELTSGSAPRSQGKRYVKSTGVPRLPLNRRTGRLHGSVTLWSRETASGLEVSVGFDASKAGRSLYAVLPSRDRRGLWAEVSRRGRMRVRDYASVFIRSQRAAFSAA